jgi:hypothetical protein
VKSKFEAFVLLAHPEATKESPNSLLNAPGRRTQLRLHQLRAALTHCAYGHCVSQREYSSSGLHRLYCAYAVHPDTPSRCSTSHQSVALALVVCLVIPLCVVTTRVAAATDILRLRRTTGCLGSSPGSSSTTSTTPRVWVPRHVARLITRLVAPLIVDYFAYTASGCLGTSRGSSRRSSSTTSPTPRVQVPRHGAARHAARRAAHRRLLRLAQARRRLLCLRRASGCLGTSRGSSRGSSRRS